MNKQHQLINTFSFFSANLTKLLPSIHWKDHPRYLRQAFQYQTLNFDEAFNETALTALPTPPINGCKPGIIASFHFGAYRLLPIWLAVNRIPVSLLVSRDVAESQGRIYQRIFERYGGAKAGLQFELLEAEDPSVIRKLCKAMDGGRFVLLFIDGNEGQHVRSDTAKRSMMKVDFLAHRLNVRTGVAALSVISGRPIYPMMLRFDDQNVPAPHTLPPITPASDLPRAKFVDMTMQTLYQGMAPLLEQYPAQWEGWFFIHHDLDLDGISANLPFIMHFLPFSVGDQCFLMHRNSYAVMPLNNALFSKFSEIYARNLLI